MIDRIRYLRHRQDKLLQWFFLTAAVEVLLFGAMIIWLEAWLAVMVWRVSLPLVMLYRRIAKLDHELLASERNWMR